MQPLFFCISQYMAKPLYPWSAVPARYLCSSWRELKNTVWWLCKNTEWSWISTHRRQGATSWRSLPSPPRLRLRMTSTSAWWSTWWSASRWTRPCASPRTCTSPWGPAGSQSARASCGRHTLSPSCIPTTGAAPSSSPWARTSACWPRCTPTAAALPRTWAGGTCCRSSAGTRWSWRCISRTQEASSSKSTPGRSRTLVIMTTSSTTSSGARTQRWSGRPSPRATASGCKTTRSWSRSRACCRPTATSSSDSKCTALPRCWSRLRTSTLSPRTRVSGREPAAPRGAERCLWWCTRTPTTASTRRSSDMKLRPSNTHSLFFHSPAWSNLPNVPQTSTALGDRSFSQPNLFFQQMQDNTCRLLPDCGLKDG